MKSGIWGFLKDDVSWAITVVGIVLVTFAIGSWIAHGVCDTTVLSTGITGITALAGRNGTAKQKQEEEKNEVPKA